MLCIPASARQQLDKLAKLKHVNHMHISQQHAALLWLVVVVLAGELAM